MGVFEDWARQYWECGISIIPVEKKTKRPVVSYDLYREELVSEELLNQWETKYKDHNIGVVTGKASRLVVIDLDIKNNPELLSKALSLLPRSPLEKFGVKGLSIFVKFNNQTGRKIRYRGQEIGELIVNTQVVVPPSIHPETNKPYVWTSYRTLGDEELDHYIDEIPDFSNNDLDIFEKLLEDSDTTVSKDFYKEVLGRNDRLKSICGAMFAKGLLPEDVAPRLLAEDLTLHHDNPLFRDEKEFKKMASQPLACAYRFSSSVFQTYLKSASSRGDLIPQFDKKKEKEIMEESEFSKYKMFFDKMFKEPKKCRLNGEAVDVKDNMMPLLMRETALQSYAKEDGLKKGDVSCHLSRFIENLKPVLLVDIPKWDGLDRVSKLCDAVKLKDKRSDIFENYIKYWGSRIFARLENPDEQNLFIILKGGQGIGKDSWVKNLIKGFKPYASKFTVQPNKEIDTIHQIASNLVLHLEEFDQSHKLNVAFLKELITCDEKTYRLPYDRSAVRRKMYASFISTANVENIFRDSTGNRRFAIFDIDTIDWSYEKGDYAQIMAQFQHLYLNKYELQKSSKSYMGLLVESMTPDGVDDEVLDIWDTRLSNLTVSRNKSELRMDDVQFVIEELRRVTGWSLRGVFNFLKQHGRSFKRGSNILYVPGRRVDLM